MNAKLAEIISIDKEKCLNCHVCIAACPVSYCNDASNEEDGIHINSDLCIGCGNCIKACSHDARVIVDDTERFFNDLKAGVKIATIVAPAIDVQIPGKLKNFLGWLKEIGVYKNFDVSFGAEITTYEYLKALADEKTNLPIIAQPCPVVVNFIEIYKPDLVKYLAPTGSPMMDMAAWVRSEYTDADLKIAAISPCIAKKREFDDPNTKDRVQYNVTIANIQKYIEENDINIDDYFSEFDGPMEAERAVLYSQPGGLYETAKRFKPNLERHQVRKVEGPEIYEEFLEELDADIKAGRETPLVVDILNCTHGCNRGTGVDYEAFSTDQVLKRQDERVHEQEDLAYKTEEDINKLEEKLEEIHNTVDLSREYTDRSASFNKLLTPNEEQLEILNEEMYKFEKEDLKNCGACGYLSCEKMAKAILNGLYRPEQCHHFLEYHYKNSKKN